jgi:hypothetical protein
VIPHAANEPIPQPATADTNNRFSINALYTKVSAERENRAPSSLPARLSATNHE